MRLKIDLYRRLARVCDESEASDIEVELIDRFGAPPASVAHLVQMAQLRVAAHHWGVRSINLEDRYVVFWYTSERRIRRLAAATGGKLRVVDGRSAYMTLGNEVSQPAQIVESVKSLLRCR